MGVLYRDTGWRNWAKGNKNIDQSEPGMGRQADATQNDSNKQEATESLSTRPGGDQPVAPKPTVYKNNWDKDIIYLCQFS
jgi:hypothetical protein